MYVGHQVSHSLFLSIERFKKISLI